MRARTLLCPLLVWTGLALAAPTTPDPRHAAAAAIDRALQMSEFLTLGIGMGLENALGNAPGAANIAACTRSKLNPAVEAAVLDLFETLLSPDQLKTGGALAGQPVFERLARYIRQNRETLLLEAAANDPPRIDHFLLATAADRLEVSTAEREAVRDFIVWHQGFIPQLNDRFAALNARLTEVAKAAARACSA